MKKPVLLAALILLSGMVYGQSGIDSKITDSCPSDYERVISLSAPNKTYSNPGPPELYQYGLCVKGIQDSKVSQSCKTNEGFYLSSKDRDAHFSDSPTYNIPVCTGQMQTAVRNSCFANETRLLSVSSDQNAHVGWPDVFENKLCGFYASPENVTLELEFNLSSSDEVYFDDSKVDEGEFRLAEFPYMVAESDEEVAGIVADGFVSAERESREKNLLKLKRESDSSTFLVPFTYGDHQTIEREEDKILGDQFLDQLSASFGFFIPEQPTVRTLLQTDVGINSSVELGQGFHTLRIEKIGENTVKLEEAP